ncbi:MAG: exodeoxyribonuclease VII large subunit, partial [Cyclobacteriaceae bacterium]
IGHERDETILDLVAHTSLKTPTAVAEFLIGGVRAYEENMQLLFQKISGHARQRIKLESQGIQQLEYRLKASVRKLTSQRELMLERRKAQLVAAVRSLLRQRSERLNMAAKSMELVHPDNILKRGYTISTVNGKPVQNVKIKPGDTMITRSIDRIIESTVISNNIKND